MTPKEYEIVFGLIEHAAKHAYELGYADAKAKKPLKNEGFAVSKANRLAIKTFLNKQTQRR